VGGILDGPLAFDNAVSAEATKTEGIVSPVAGRADIFLVPDLEAGNSSRNNSFIWEKRTLLAYCSALAFLSF
jgi:hypothetical protein